MANPEHVARLKERVTAWNAWRRQSPDVLPELSEADLNEADLTGADLTEADLSGASLSGADLSRTTLTKADLTAADLSWAHLLGTDLTQADLSGALLVAADLSKVNLNAAGFNGATFGATILSDTDLSQAKGLESVHHESPSTIGIDTIVQSRGNIPEAFLRGAGVPDVFIANMKALVGAMEPISCTLPRKDYWRRDVQWPGLGCSQVGRYSQAHLLGHEGPTGITIRACPRSKTRVRGDGVDRDRPADHSRLNGTLIPRTRQGFGVGHTVIRTATTPNPPALFLLQ